MRTTDATPLPELASARRDEYGLPAMCCWTSYLDGRTRGHTEGYAEGWNDCQNAAWAQAQQIVRNAAADMGVKAARDKAGY